MGKGFEQQSVLGSLPIEETEIPTQKRSGALPGLCGAPKEIFVDPKWNQRIFGILGGHQIAPGKQRVGREWICGKCSYWHKCGHAGTSVTMDFTILQISILWPVRSWVLKLALAAKRFGFHTGVPSIALHCLMIDQ